LVVHAFLLSKFNFEKRKGKKDQWEIHIKKIDVESKIRVYPKSKAEKN
jgi:hypothetical protein